MWVAPAHWSDPVSPHESFQGYRHDGVHQFASLGPGARTRHIAALYSVRLTPTNSI